MDSAAFWLWYFGTGGILAWALRRRLVDFGWPPTALVMWTTGIVAFPLLGLAYGLLLGREKNHDAQPAPAIRPLVKPVCFWPDGEAALRGILEAIHGAKTTVDVSTYIYSHDAVGRQITDALHSRAREGIRVRLLADGLRSGAALRPLAASVGSPHFLVRAFMPLRSLAGWRGLNHRLHRKMILIDDKLLVAGGQNLDGRFLGDGPQVYRDFSLCMTDGETIRTAKSLFERDWSRAGCAEDVSDRYELSSAANGPSASSALIPSGPDFEGCALLGTAERLIQEAREELCLCAPYFVLPPAILAVLESSIRRDVGVRIFVPSRSTSAIADLARERQLRRLSALGCQVSRVGPPMLHAKCVIVDRRFALMGSANLDSRSLRLNYEVAILHEAPETVEQLRAWLEALVQRHPARPCDFASRDGPMGRLCEWAASWLSPML